MACFRFRFPAKRGRPMLKDKPAHQGHPERALTAKNRRSHCDRLAPRAALTLLEYLEESGRLTFQERSALEGYHKWLLIIRKGMQAPTVTQWSYSVLKVQSPGSWYSFESNDEVRLGKKIAAARNNLNAVFTCAPADLKQLRPEFDKLMLDHFYNIGVFVQLPYPQQEILTIGLRKLARSILVCTLKKVGKN